LTLVIDASVALSWCLTDEANLGAQPLLDVVLAEGGFVPAVWPLEVIDGLVMAVRRNRVPAAAIIESLDVLAQLPVVVEADHWVATGYGTAAIAQRFNLTAYDASYLLLAARREVPLATGDRRLQAAAALLGIRTIAT
jgi:predicted nucleic acid-binding protein